MKWSKSVLRQYIATFSCLMCSVMTSIGFVWYTPLMVWLLSKENDEIPDLRGANDQLAWLVAIVEVGELLGPLPCGFIADRWGRKVALLVTFPLILTSWIVLAFSRSLISLYAARLLQGTTIGFFFTAGPVYLVEIARADIRGELSGHLQTTWFIGVLYAYCTGPFLSYQHYIYASTLPCLLFFFTFIFMPETPYFCAMKMDSRSAEESLVWLRGGEDVSEELKTIHEAVEREKVETKGGWKDLFLLPKCRKPLMIMTVFGIVKYIGGTATVPAFVTQTISKSSGGDAAPYISIGMGLILLLATLAAAFVTDRLGRRPLVIASVSMVGVSSGVLAIFYFVDKETSYDTSSLQWVVYTGFVVYCLGLNIGLGPLQTTLQAEYFPTNVRSASGAFCNILRNVLLFFSIKQYQLIDDNFGLYANFLLFTLVSFLGLFILCPFMDETANRSLGQIQTKRG